MKTTRLLLVLALTAAGLAATTSPASAVQCVGIGGITTNSYVYYPGLGPSASGFFDGYLTPSTCIDAAPPVYFGGAFSTFANPTGNFCGVGEGEIYVAGRTGTFLWQGATLTVVGEVSGVLTIYPDAFSGESCTTGARRFLVAGTLAW